MSQPAPQSTFANSNGTLRMLLHLPNFIRLYSRLWRDPRVSWLPKALLVGRLMYFIITVD